MDPQYICTACATIMAHVHPYVYLITYILRNITSHVHCKHSNGERASLANLIDYMLFVGMLLVCQKLS